jgi:hypothetical protein
MWRNKATDNNAGSSEIFILCINEIRSIPKFCLKIMEAYRDKKV